MPQYRIACEQPHAFPAGNKGAHGQPASKRFSQQQDIGDNTISLESPQRPRAPEACLDLVEYKQGASGITALPQLLQPGTIRNIYSPFRLDRLDNDAGRMRRYDVQCSRTVVFDMPDAGKKGPESISPIFIAHNAKRPLRRTMIRMPEGYDLRPARDPFGQLHGTFGRFGAAVCKIHGIK